VGRQNGTEGSENAHGQSDTQGDANLLGENPKDVPYLQLASGEAPARSFFIIGQHPSFEKKKYTNGDYQASESLAKGMFGPLYC